jgi:hypothetical protein
MLAPVLLFLAAWLFADPERAQGNETGSLQGELEGGFASPAR